jgi:hypothetical protein
MAAYHKALCTLCLERTFAGWEGGKAERAPALDSQPLVLE